MSQFYKGFSSLRQELSPTTLPVLGKLPEWLSGRLLRNGPALFEVDGQKYQHWFDGLAMLHCFAFRNGTVTYTNRFLQSPAYQKAMKTQRISYPEFATNPEQSWLGRMTAYFQPNPYGANANVNISKIANHWVALTETPTPVRFYPDNLSTIGVLSYEDQLKGQHCTAHPHYDWKRRLSTNTMTTFGRKSHYTIYTIQDGETQRRLLGRIPVEEPGYIHSFGITERYVILVEFPLVVSPLELLFSGKPFIENFRWKPERGARFYVLSREDGVLHRIYETDAFFAFHHVNAFEWDGQICVDIVATADNGLLEHFYLNRILHAESPPPGSFLMRYHLPLDGETIQAELLSDAVLELPRIHYRACNMQDYRFVYGISLDLQGGSIFYDRLCKISISGQQYWTWFEPGCYPGEPVFVPAPGAEAEDDGVLLSVVLDGKAEHSFLLALDAKTLSELARSPLPHAVPFGFHGVYIS
jgi:beta,beta-carotene 9',10'-dioxygenase